MLELVDLLKKRVVHDMPAAEYHAAEALGSSTIRALLSSTPAHALYRLQHSEQSESMALGTAVHCAVLTPALYKAEIAVAPKCDRRTKDGKELYARFLESAVGKTVISEEQQTVVERISAEIRDRRTASALLDRCQQRELSLFHLDKYATKARLDAYGRGIVIDIKTTRDASRAAFERSISQYGYGIQAAHYRRVIEGVGLPFTDFIFIVVETEPPHGVAVYAMEEEVMALYEPQVEQALTDWTVCQETQSFRAYPDEIQKVSVPRWLRRQLEEGVAA
jgi:hypothetical protein